MDMSLSALVNLFSVIDNQAQDQTDFKNNK